MAGLEGYPELRGKFPSQQGGMDPFDQRSSSASMSPRKRVPVLVEEPPQLISGNVDNPDGSFDMDHYANLGIGTVGLFLQNVGTHPFIVLRRQCQVSSESARCHRSSA